jgi:O-methyltransferase involved in polyketide biosynthesis
VQDYDFNRVSVTALIPAFARAEYTDIPLAKEMFGCLSALGVSLEEGPWNENAVQRYAAFFEARFKAVNRILEEYKAAQVLELAAGLSPRGMDFAKRGIVYVEADLAESTARKREVVTAVLGHVPATLHLCAASVLDREELLACCHAFTNGPVAIATEGLLRYLTFPEKQQLASNVHEILSSFGGFWVTTDIHLRHWAQAHGRPFPRVSETERLGRNLDPNYFDDLEHAREFFERCGFEVESRPLLEGIREQVISLPNATEELLAELNDRRTFTLRVPTGRI